MIRKYCYVLLTCEPGEEQKLAQVLLEKRLIACAKFMPVSSLFWWEGKIADDTETMVLMETAEDLYDDIEAEVAKLHSYETFVLTQIPITRLNKKAAAWMQSELREAKTP